MEDYSFETFTLDHQDGVIEIFNYYIENSTAAYREHPVGKEKYLEFIEDAKCFPGYAIINQDNKIVGFCMLEPYMSFSTFSEVVEISYFIDKEHTGKGIGSIALRKLEIEAKIMGKNSIDSPLSSRVEGNPAWRL